MFSTNVSLGSCQTKIQKKKKEYNKTTSDWQRHFHFKFQMLPLKAAQWKLKQTISGRRNTSATKRFHSTIPYWVEMNSISQLDFTKWRSSGVGAGLSACCRHAGAWDYWLACRHRALLLCCDVMQCAELLRSRVEHTRCCAAVTHVHEERQPHP